MIKVTIKFVTVVERYNYIIVTIITKKNNAVISPLSKK